MKLFIDKGDSRFSIVIPKKHSVKEKAIADDFAELTKGATGCELKILHDTDAKSGVPVISFGKTRQFDESGISLPDDLGKSGFIIKTVGDSVFICGEDKLGFGTMCGGYELLSRLFGFEPYSHNYIRLNKTESVALPYLDVKDVPDFQMRKDPVDIPYGRVFKDRQRFILWDEFLISVPGYGEGHNSFGFVEPKIYKDEHPEWFNETVTQLALKARGDEESAKKMEDVAFESLVKFAEDNPDKDYICFAHQDDPVMDKYDVAYSYEKYGAKSGVWLEFVNKLAVRIREYFNEKKIDRQMKIVFYAYVFLAAPPVKKGDDGKYYPTIKADKNVIPLYCPIFQDEGTPINSRKNEKFSKELENWRLVANEVWVWYYNAGFYDFIFPRYGFDQIPETVRYTANLGIPFYFEEGATYCKNPWSFSELQNYLLSKLCWDTSLDEEVLIRDWFDNVFGLASTPMYQVFTEMRKRHREYTELFDVELRTDVQQYKTKFFWTKDTIDRILGLMLQALAVTEIYKEKDEKRYRQIKNAILTEKIAFMYAFVYLHRQTSEYSDEYMYAYVKSMKHDVEEAGIEGKSSEHSEISFLWREFGV